MYSLKQKNVKKQIKDAYVWVIGVDSDQYEEGQVGDENVTLTSMLKRVDIAVKNIAELATEGEFPGGEVTTYGLADEGIALADSRGAIPEDVLDEIENSRRKLQTVKSKFQNSELNKYIIRQS